MALVRLVICVLITGFAAACASSGAVPKPFPGAPAPTGSPEAAGAPADPVGPPTPGEPATPAENAPTSRFDPRAVVQSALGFRGVPYRNGGSDPSGFDCSGLVQYTFAQHGVALPREVKEQYQFGEEVRLAGIEPGDLLFFATASGGPSHVGVAIGGDEFVHAPSTRGVVRVERFSAPYWSSRIVAVRRIR